MKLLSKNDFEAGKSIKLELWAFQNLQVQQIDSIFSGAQESGKQNLSWI
jgi:hypothetical protein